MTNDSRHAASGHRVANARAPMQVCFTVPDLDAAIPEISRFTGAGPWFRVPRLQPDDDRTTYRSVPSNLDADITLAYAGNTMYELVAPGAGSRSIFSEWVERFGHGLHHFGFLSECYDRDVAALESSNGKPLMTSVTGRGARVAMFENDGPTDTLHEVIELTDASRSFYERLRRDAATRLDASEMYTQSSE